MLCVFNTHPLLELVYKGKKNNLTSMIQTCLYVMSSFFSAKYANNCGWVMIMDLWVSSDRKVSQFVHRLRFSSFSVAMCYISTVIQFCFHFATFLPLTQMNFILQTTYEILNCVCGIKKKLSISIAYFPSSTKLDFPNQ